MQCRHTFELGDFPLRFTHLGSSTVAIEIFIPPLEPLISFHLVTLFRGSDEVLSFGSRLINVFLKSVTPPIPSSPLVDKNWSCDCHRVSSYTLLKTERTINALEWVLTNASGLGTSIRETFTSVTYSVLLYGALYLVWRSEIEQVREHPHQITKDDTNRTVGTHVTIALAGVPPIDLLTRGPESLKTAIFVKVTS